MKYLRFQSQCRSKRRNRIRTLADIYSCPGCSGIVAEGNSFCRGCGRRFSVSEMKSMREKPKSVVGGSPWNIRDVYRCVHCLEFICIDDTYCRGCGDHICNKEKQLMRANFKEVARNNYPSLILCMGFVLMVIAVLYVVNA